MKLVIQMIYRKPMRGARYRIIKRNKSPMLPAVHAIPMTRARPLQNQWSMAETAGVN